MLLVGLKILYSSWGRNMSMGVNGDGDFWHNSPPESGSKSGDVDIYCFKNVSQQRTESNNSWARETDYCMAVRKYIVEVIVCGSLGNYNSL